MRVLSVNERKEERYAVNILATIFTADGQSVTGTMIVDRSGSGAKLKVAGSPFLPKMILLVDFQNKSVFECEVKWSRNGHIGVQIIDEFGRARRNRFFETHTPPKSQTLEQKAQFRNDATLERRPPTRRSSA